MKSIGKAAEFLRKAAAAMRGKAAVLRARLLFLASLRRRAAVVAGISRHLRSLAPSHRGHEKAAVSRAMVLSSRPVDHTDVDDDERAGTRDGDVVVGMAELARLFQEVEADGGDEGGYQDWTLALHALFDDEVESHGCCCGDEPRRAGRMDDGVEGLEDDDEPSVLEPIRSVREGDGQEFRIDDEIDRAAGMFITRVRRRMSKQTADELVVSSLVAID